MLTPESVPLSPTCLSGHPAVRAWHRLRPRGNDPEAVETVFDRTKTTVYRLAGAGPGGAPVIGKRCRRDVMRVEDTVYAEALPQLQLRTLHYYGSVADEDASFGWLFLEDAGGEAYSVHVEEHRVIAARWLGVLHTTVWSADLPGRLPDGGSACYWEHLLWARDRMRTNRSNPTLGDEDRAVLDDLVAACERLACCWDCLEAASQRLPRTLVHGDFRGKNLRVRNGEGGLELLPLDWEMAGWGSPLADLGKCPDLHSYWSAVRQCWPDLGLEELQRLANCGKVFLLAAKMSWASSGLACKWNSRPLRYLRCYAAEAPELLRLVETGGSA